MKSDWECIGVCVWGGRWQSGPYDGQWTLYLVGSQNHLGQGWQWRGCQVLGRAVWPCACGSQGWGVACYFNPALKAVLLISPSCNGGRKGPVWTPVYFWGGYNSPPAPGNLSLPTSTANDPAARKAGSLAGRGKWQHSFQGRGLKPEMPERWNWHGSFASVQPCKLVSLCSRCMDSMVLAVFQNSPLSCVCLGV